MSGSSARASIGRNPVHHLRRFHVLALGSLFLIPACAESRPLVDDPSRAVERTRVTTQSPVSIESVQVRLTLREDGTWKQVYESRYKILDRSAVDGWGATQARYSPWYTKRPTVSAKVINRDESGAPRVYALDQSLLSEEPAYPQAPDLYGDAKILRAPLPKVDVGSVIHETITTESHRVFLHPAYVHRAYFDSSVPVKSAKFVVSAPKSLDLVFKVFDAQVKRSEKSDGDRVIVTYEGGPYEALEELEGSLPPDVPRWPHVAVTTGSSWKELAQQYDQVVNEALDGIDFRSSIKEIVSPQDDDRTKMTKVLQWVKDRVRYVGVEFGDSAVIPYAPDKTLSRGFGDCKDQATLMVGLLRAAGIKAEVALLLAGTGEDISPDLPALNVFDHAIVHVSAPEELYIDPTGDFFTVGNLPTGDQGRYALIAGGKHSGLVKTPQGDAKLNRYEDVRTVTLKPSGAPDVVEVSKGEGFFDWDLRYAFSPAAEQLEENLTSYAENVYGSEAVDGIEHSDPFDLSTPFTGKLIAKDSTMGNTNLLESWANLSEHVLFSWLPSSMLEGEEDRKAPLYLHTPYRAEVNWVVKPPPAFVRSALPAEAKRDFGAGSYARRVEAHEDGSVAVRTQLELNRSVLSADDVAAFREAYAAWGAANIPQVIYRHKAWDLTKKGHVVQAVDYLRGEIDGGKDVALNQLRMSHVIRPYMEERAILEAKKALRISPEDVAVWEEYAAIVTDNAMGEDLGRGYDRDEALRAYGKIYSLDDEKLYAKLRRAVVLEHSEAGERYESDPKDMLEALEIYDSVPEKELREFEDGGFLQNALFTLFWAEQYEELDRRLKALPSEEAPLNLQVMSAAALEGARAALSTAEQLHLDESEKSSILQETSGLLVRRGDYVGAAELLDAIRTDGKTARALTRRATMLRRLARTNPRELAEDTPASFAIKMMSLSVVREESDEGFALRYLAEGAKKKGAESALVETILGLKQDLPPRVTSQFMLDLMSHGYKAVVEGDEKRGYRVKLSFEYGRSNTASLYVIKEGGRYKVRAMSDHIGEIGAGAWEALKTGNKERARQWLDWGREILHIGSAEDPLGVVPFGKLWNDGKGDMEAAAATLAASSDSAKEMLPYLQKRLAKAESSSERQVFLHALVHVYYRLRDDEQYLKTAKKLYAEVPDSTSARKMVLNGLWKTKNYEAYRRMVEGLYAKATTSAEKQEYQGRLASVLSHQGNIAEAKRIRLQVIKESPNAAGQYNSAAWLGLFGTPDDSDIKLALRAVELDRTSGKLHTLACLYAELGRIDEAGKTLAELRSFRPNHELISIDWYIVGRIAEHLGFKDEAANVYRQVDKPEEDSPTSTYALAQKALRRL